MSGMYIPKGHIPEEGHDIIVLSDGHAYYDNLYGDLGETILVRDHGPLVDRDDICNALRNFQRQRKLEGRDVTFKEAFMLISIAPPVIPADRKRRIL